MLPDSVLRCRIPVRLHGITLPQVFDAIQDESSYQIILEWGEAPDGHRPRLFVMVEAADVFPVDDPLVAYELECHTVIDLDEAEITDVDDPAKTAFLRPP
ncbi:MAG: hypothetical protein IPK22_01585 [Verrucomicrobiaceae bacterium]|nr:hypothetical protein [Verrucomicrobiaceae bacterium]